MARSAFLTALLLIGVTGCPRSPEVTRGKFTDSYTLAVQRGSADVVVETSGPATYSVTTYPIDHPMGGRPSIEATFKTPAGTFTVSNHNQQAPGLDINGTFYPEPNNVAGRSIITIDAKGGIRVDPPKAAAPVPGK